jgi:hypothetical protein
VLLALAAFAYVLVRVQTVGPTYDEVSTIQYFVPASLAKIFNARDANSHLLNTLFIKMLFASGHKTLSLARLPNACAFAVYLYYGLRLARRITGRLLGISLVALLVANPFLLDFFGLARGYGIALGAQMVSIYYLTSFPTTSRPGRAIALSLFAAAVSVLAVFSWLHYYVAVACTGLGLAMFYRRAAAAQTVKLTVSISAVLALTLYVPVRQLQRGNALFYGGHRDFYHDTMVSLAKYTAYSPNATRGVIIALDGIVLTLLIAICLSFIRRSRGRNAQVRTAMVTATALLGLAAASPVVQHYLLGTPYLIDRTALFLYPLTVLTLCLGLVESLGSGWGAATAAALAAAATVNLMVHANTQKTVLWFFDAHSREILQAVNDAGERSGRIQRLEFAWPFEQSVRYELAHGSFHFVEIVRPLDPVDQSDFNPTADYYIHLGIRLENFDYDPAAQKALADVRGIAMCFDAESTCLYRLK